MPRPVNLASDRIDVRVPVAEKVAWDAAARSEGLTLQQWILRALRVEMRRVKRRGRSLD